MIRRRFVRRYLGSKYTLKDIIKRKRKAILFWRQSVNCEELCADEICVTVSKMDTWVWKTQRLRCTFLCESWCRGIFLA